MIKTDIRDFLISIIAEAEMPFNILVCTPGI